jgi:hypothetical protein
MEFYSVTKKNELLSLAGKWMELENIIFSQGQKAKAVCFLSYAEYRLNTSVVIL